MTTTAIRKELSKAINNINDELFLNALYTIVKTHNKNDDYAFSDEELKIINDRIESYNTGKAKTYSPIQFKKKLMKSLGK